LQQVTFKHFTQTKPLPTKVIILLTNTREACAGLIVNAGLQAAYKEYKEGVYYEEPAAHDGVPAVGEIPWLKPYTRKAR
jgi:hypothetical protein